jgi:hypothetical protein
MLEGGLRPGLSARHSAGCPGGTQTVGSCTDGAAAVAAAARGGNTASGGGGGAISDVQYIHTAGW